MKKIMGFVLCVIGLILLMGSIIAYLQADAMNSLQIVLNAAGAACFAFGAANLYDIYMKGSRKGMRYEIEEKDERNIMLREKASYLTLQITMLLIGAISVVSFAINALLPSLLCIGLLVLQPIFMALFQKYYSAKL